MEIEKALIHSAAKYPVTRVEVKSFTINSGLSSVMLSNIVNGRIPYRIIYGLTTHESFNGDYKKSGYIFNHHNLKSTGIYINGSLFKQPLEMRYSDDDEVISEHIVAYNSLFCDTAESGEIIDINYNDYKDFYCLYAYDLTQDRCTNLIDHLNPSHQGELAIKLDFGRPVTQNLTIITYLEFPGLIQLDKARQVFTDF